MSKRTQITVPLAPALRAFLEREAAKEDRPMAGVIRRLLAEAARKADTQERAA
jgi:hypothetical protein